MFSIRLQTAHPTRLTQFLGAGAIFSFLTVNVWLAVDHYQTQNPVSRKAIDAMEGVKQIAKQRSVLLAARPDSGPINLHMMQRAGVHIPNSFIHGANFASPWGQSQIVKQYDVLVWDFNEITASGCTQLLGNSSAIAGVFRVATSARAADEKPAPLSRDDAEQQCRRTPLMARLFLK